MGIEKIWNHSYDPFEDLSKHHLEQLRNESGLTYEILNIARPFSLCGRFVKEYGLRNETLERLNLPCYPNDLLIFPYPGYGDIFRARLDVPQNDREGKTIRYKQPRKQRNVPYELIPGTLKFEDIIFITEGEKKAMALAQAGCYVLGFGGVWNWKDKPSPSGIIPDLESSNFKGRTVAIVFDSDITSNKNVLTAEGNLAEYCIANGAAKVFRVRIPYGGNQKMGIDDYLKGRDWNVIDDLLTSAIVEQGFITGFELMRTPLEPSIMLTPFLPERSFVLIAGVPGAGKTEFFIHQTIEAAKQGLVLYYLNEGGLLNLQTRQKAYCQDESILKNILWELKRLPDFRDPKGIEKFERVLKAYRPKVVFIDPGPDAFGEENDASALKEPLARLYQLTEKHNVCIVFSWHFSKSQSFSGVYSLRGSSAIVGKMDLVYDLNVTENKRCLRLDKLRLDCLGLHQGQKWIIDMSQTDTGKELRFIDAQEASEARYERKREILSDALLKFDPEKEYSTTEISNIMLSASEGDFKEGTAKKYLREWVKEGFFRLSQDGRGKKPALYLRTNKEPTLQA